MSDFQEYLRYLVTLTAVLDPFLAVPIFLGVTSAANPAGRRRLAYIVTLTVFAVLAAFQVGGGLVLLLMALAMLNARVGEMRQTQAEARELESGELSGVVPLAVPLLAGPGAISTTIINAQKDGLVHVAALIVCIALVCGVPWWVLRIADAVGPKMGTTGLNIATRLLGLLLAAIAIQTMAEGLKELFPGLA